jgi:hypothetical protein
LTRTAPQGHAEARHKERNPVPTGEAQAHKRKTQKPMSKPGTELLSSNTPDFLKIDINRKKKPKLKGGFASLPSAKHPKIKVFRIQL